MRHSSFRHLVWGLMVLAALLFAVTQIALLGGGALERPALEPVLPLLSGAR